jgi:hypothetical protein
MKKENDLRDLLDRLKVEVSQSSAPAEPRPEAVPEEPPAPPPQPVIRQCRPERPAPQRPEFQRPDRQQYTYSQGNPAWSENKEAMLFGVLASLVAVLGGVLGGVEYVVLAGAVAFLLFSFVMVLALVGYYLDMRKRQPQDSELNDQVRQLARRLDALAARNAGTPQGAGGGAVRDRELERKVEELRTLVKALAKAVDAGGGNG